MSGILRLESLTKGNTLKQGDKTPLKYRLFDADGETLNIAGKSATVRLVYPDFLTIGYEKGGLTVAQDDTVTFTIDNVIPSRIYHVEIIVDDKYIFPSRADESKFTVDKSSLGTESNIVEIVGVDAVVRKAVDLINQDPSLIIDEDKLVTDIISNTGIGNINEYYKAFNDLKPKAEQSITKSAEALTKSQNALNVANGIDAKATNALSLSKSADTLSKSVQEQFNQVVIDGDSSVEAAQARVDASGQTNATLKARLDKEHNEVTAQLAQTVKKSDTGVLDLNVFDETSRNILQGQEPGTINAVLGKGNVKNDNLSEGLALDKFEHIKSYAKSKNLLDITTVIHGGYYNIATGAWIANEIYRTSQPIAITPDKTYCKQAGGFVTYWDKDLNFVSGANAGAIFKVPNTPTIAFVRVTLTAPFDEWMLLEGNVYPSVYEPYSKGYEIDTNYITIEDNLMTDSQKILLNNVTKEDLGKLNALSFERINLLDPKKVTAGGYYSILNGSWTATQYDSIEVEVEHNRHYSIPANGMTTFWTKDNVFVSGVSTAKGSFKVPNDPTIVKMRIGVARNSPVPIAQWMIVKGTVYPDKYIPYEQVNISEIEKLKRSIDGVSRNSIGYIDVNVDGHTQVTHPSILYFKDGWNGYRFWMAVTPFPNAQAINENPCIVVSNNLINWVEPLIGMNPLDASPNANQYYNSDTELVYNSTTDTMEVWWRRLTLNPSPTTETIMRRTTKDGINWTDREELFSVQSLATTLSPSVQIDSDGTYMIWTINGARIKYYETPDGRNWELIREINLPRPVWHGSIKYTGEKYEAYFSYGKGASSVNYYIGYSESTDNITYSDPAKVLDAVPFRYDHELYRPSFIDCHGFSKRNTIRVIPYGMISDDNKWNVGISLAYKEAPTMLRGLNFIE